MQADHDVVIVGGSIAGLTAATFYARRGARVAVLEKSPDPDHYKVMCTHFIQPSAVPTMERLGIVPELEALGAQRCGTDAWSRYGWHRDEEEAKPINALRPLSIRRQVLDPVLRRTAAAEPNVTYLGGETVTDLVWDGDRVAGVVARGRDRRERTLRAKLVVAADGRDGRMGRLARVPARVSPNNRFAYMGYFAGLPQTGSARSKIWFLDPQMGYIFRNDDGLSVVAAFVTKDQLPAWKRDPKAAFTRHVEALPDEPPLVSEATLVDDKLYGKLDMPNRRRPAAARGMAFAGDAATSADPLFGIGCGWAFESAEWLVQETARAVLGEEPLNRALARYARRHAAWFGPHHWLVSDFATGRPFSPVEKLLFKAIPHDEVTAERFRALAERRVPAASVMKPTTLARAARVAARA